MGDGIMLADIVFISLTTVIASYQMTTFARKVGNARQKFKVDPPAVDGDPGFLRTFRAQQNCIEFFTLFLAVMWISGLFFHQVPASVAGLGYCYGRHLYFHGYAKDVKDRLAGFKLCVRFLTVLLVQSLVGISHFLLVSYAGINIKQMVIDGIGGIGKGEL